MTRTLYDKLVDAHRVCDLPDGDMLVYVDFHIMNEYTSPQAFSGLETKGLSVWRPEAHLAVIDHVNATRSRHPHDAASKLLIDNLEANCVKHNIAFYGLGGIGISALAATKLYKLNKVFAIDINDDRLELAKDFGATHTLNLWSCYNIYNVLYINCYIVTI